MLVTELSHPDRRTLLYVVCDGKVLLGLKKRGLGEGKYNGIGGGVESGETPVEAVIREAQEEVRVEPVGVRHAGNLHFTLPGKERKMYVYVFRAEGLTGKPEETDEVAPTWFPVGAVPYWQMWEDDPHWLPRVLEGQFVMGTFTFDQDNKLASWKVEPVWI